MSACADVFVLGVAVGAPACEVDEAAAFLRRSPSWILSESDPYWPWLMPNLTVIDSYDPFH